VTRSSPTTLLWPKAGAERRRLARSAALGGASRCGMKFGGAAAFPGKRARARAPAGHRGGVGGGWLARDASEVASLARSGNGGWPTRYSHTKGEEQP
jgi:hypothetical protein